MLTADVRRRPARTVRLPHGPRWRVKALLLAVILLALAVRIWGLDFGLPYLYHADEPLGVRTAQNMVKTGDLNPRFFGWSSLFFYVNALSYLPYYAVGRLMGVFTSPADIPGATVITLGVGKTPMPSTILLGRMVSVLFGVAAVPLIYSVGRRLTDNVYVGLLAALMMAVSWSNVIYSKYIRPESLLVFVVLLAFFGAVQVFKRGRTGDYVLAGVGIGLTMSVKYNGALIALPLVVAHFLRHGPRGIKEPRIYLAFMASVMAFLVTMPYAILDFQEFLADFRYHAQVYATGHPGSEGDALRWYVNTLFHVEGIAVVLACLEVIRGIYRRSRPILLTAVFPVVYFAFISSFEVRNGRTYLPLTPFLLLLAASFLVYLFQQVRRLQWSPRTAPVYALWTLLVVATLATPVATTVRENRKLTIVDSRYTASVWIEQHLRADARVAVEPYSPYVDPKRFSVRGLGSIAQHAPDWYVAKDYDYLVFSEGTFGRYYRQPDRYSDRVSRYDELFRTFRPVKTFNDGGYDVRILRVTDALTRTRTGR